MSGAADTLLAHALGVQWPALPAPAQQAALTFLHDTLCVGVAGRNAAHADALWSAVQQWSPGAAGGHGGCPILGRPQAGAGAADAAFVNAFQIHSQEFDCVHEPAVAHPMATVVAALLAQAARAPVAGADLLAALVAGVDVVAALGTAGTTPLKFFRPATAGIFGSVAALCRLRGLDLATSRNAFGCALAFAAGTMQAHLEGKPTLAVQVAGAARSAVQAVDLAVAGVPGPAAAIDGPFGYLPLFEDGFNLAGPLARLGRVFAVTELSCKPFPTGRAAHGAIVALQALRTGHGVTPQNLQQLTYHAPPLIVRLVGRAAFNGMGVAHARLCLPYLGALVLAHGTVGLDDFAPERMADLALLDLATRIAVHDDGNPNPAAFVPARAVALLHGGRSVEVAVTQQFGSPAWPLSRQQHLAKAQACLAFGGLPDAHQPLVDAIAALPASRNSAATLAPAFGATG